ncbi:MAG: BPSS1780 family membrane protein [Burkholderiales bacterium]
MKLNTVPARQGLLWAQQGVRVFFRRPLAYTALFATFLFGAFVLALLPIIGPVLSLMLLPLVTQAFMLATRIVVDGGVPTPMVLVAPLRVDRPRVISMLWLGAIYAVTALGALWLSGIVDGGALASLMEGVPEGPNAAEAMAAKFAAPGLLSGLALRLGLTGLLAIPFWHAPALVYWDGQRCAQALFSSTLACWRNRGAFMVYGAAWFALVMAFGMVANLVLAAIGNSQLFAVAGLPISLIITTVFYASLYFTFADSFSPGETAP